jgi:tRNA dimethylallyltransferase
MNKVAQPKIIAVVGQTASGKSALAVLLAKKFNGEIISADSRQVYSGLNIGTGKITKKEMSGIPHHLLDVYNPKKRFTVDLYKKLADEVILEILSRGKLPIICGGTGFYVDAVVKNIILPNVPVNAKLRNQLSKKTSEQVYNILQKLDAQRAQTIGKFNKVRLIRAIEIAKSLGKVPQLKSEPLYNTLTIGIKVNENTLKEKIKERLLSRINQGMIKEAKDLQKAGLSWKRMDELGLEYRALSQHLQGKISKLEMIDQLNHAIWQYARRQNQWFKRDKSIKWFDLKNMGRIDQTILKFLKSE